MDTRTITALGLRVRVLEVAPDAERDDAVLLVHGLGGWAENWRPVMPAIAASGRRAIAFDLPGFGESERARDPRYFDAEAPFYGRFMVALLDAMGIDRVHLAGHSFGGAVALTSAIWSPERVRSLTLVAPGGLGAALPPGFRFLVLPFMEHVARWRRSPAVTRAVLYSCFHDPANCPEEVVAEALRYGEPSVGEMIRVLRAGVSFRHGIRDEVRRPWLERRDRYRGPVLVVWGREDRVLPASLVDDARQLAPDAEVRVIPSCGHLVMVERPRAFTDAFVPFLDRAIVSGGVGGEPQPPA
jgi:pyruvate dehydrogenase E2 component (dihydrolipoamide acetyltransferase)